MSDAPETMTSTDQSEFADAQEVLQMPPEYRDITPNPKKRWMIVGVLVGLLLIFVLWIATRKSEPPEEIVVVPTPTPTPEMTQLQKEMLLLEEQMITADPSDDFDALPPIDMNVTF